MDPEEAQDARDSYAALDDESKTDLLSFLGLLRAPQAPNADVLSDDD